MAKFKVTTPRDEYIVETETIDEAKKQANEKEKKIAEKYQCLPGMINVIDVSTWEEEKRKLINSPMIIDKTLFNEIERQISNDLISPKDFKLLLK